MMKILRVPCGVMTERCSLEEKDFPNYAQALRNQILLTLSSRTRDGKYRYFLGAIEMEGEEDIFRFKKVVGEFNNKLIDGFRVVIQCDQLEHVIHEASFFWRLRYRVDWDAE